MVLAFRGGKLIFGLPIFLSTACHPAAPNRTLLVRRAFSLQRTYVTQELLHITRTSITTSLVYIVSINNVRLS